MPTSEEFSKKYDTFGKVAHIIEEIGKKSDRFFHTPFIEVNGLKIATDIGRLLIHISGQAADTPEFADMLTAKLKQAKSHSINMASHRIGNEVAAVIDFAPKFDKRDELLTYILEWARANEMLDDAELSVAKRRFELDRTNEVSR